MKKIFGVAATLAVLATGTASSGLAATCDTGALVRFTQHAFSYETAYTNATYHSSLGSGLSIVGIVAEMCSPLVLDPSKQYTFYCTGLTSAGTAHFPVGPTMIHATDYAGGTWAIYEDAVFNAPTAGSMPALPSALVPANFTDGTPILSGVFSSFHVDIAVTGAVVSGSFRADYAATGGSMFPAVGGGTALFQGVWCPTPACTPATYSAHPDGKWDAPPTTATSSSTWGKVKQLYR